MILAGYATLMLLFTILRNLPIDLLGVESVDGIFYDTALPTINFTTSPLGNTQGGSKSLRHYVLPVTPSKLLNSFAQFWHISTLFRSEHICQL